jgi:hypothetical protein
MSSRWGDIRCLTRAIDLKTFPTGPAKGIYARGVPHSPILLGRNGARVVDGGAIILLRIDQT